jgi:hypothetical protein
MLLLKICIALIVQALNGGGGVDNIKPQKAKNLPKKRFVDALCKAQFYIFNFF